MCPDDGMWWPEQCFVMNRPVTDRQATFVAQQRALDPVSLLLRWTEPSHTLGSKIHFPGVAAMIFSLHVTKLTACVTPVDHPATNVNTVAETLKCINIRLSGFGLQQMGKHFVAKVSSRKK